MQKYLTAFAQSPVKFEDSHFIQKNDIYLKSSKNIKNTSISMTLGPYSLQINAELWRNPNII